MSDIKEEVVAEVKKPEVEADNENWKAKYIGLKAKYEKESNIWKKTPVLTKMFKDHGGLEEASQHFLKLNSNLFKIEDEAELKKAFETSVKNCSYMFKKKENADFKANPFESSSLKYLQKSQDTINGNKISEAMKKLFK